MKRLLPLPRRSVIPAVLAALAMLGSTAAHAQTPLPFTGVSLAGGEFNHPKPGSRPIYGKNYVYPTVEELDYFARHGLNIIRLPFLWENLQPNLNGPLDTDDLDRVASVVKEATDRKLVVLLDPHNYARYYDQTIGTPEVPDAAFADFWRKLAARFRENQRVWFGLMNEPHDLPTVRWLGSVNAAIAAIRRAGAANLVLVPGGDWTGAHTWVSNTGNSAVMNGVEDPWHHYVFEVHQYLDTNSSGKEFGVVSATIGSQRLETFTRWCREHKQRAFLGEFATGNTEMGEQAIGNMLGYMEHNSDVWTGYTWWAAGPWWGDYMYSLEPRNGVDSPLLRWLTPHLHRVPGVAH